MASAAAAKAAEVMAYIVMASILMASAAAAKAAEVMAYTYLWPI